MLANRSMPPCTVIPELAYPDAGTAIEWLCDAFGFTLRLRIGNHRAQLNVGDGAVVLTELGGGKGYGPLGTFEFGQPHRSELTHSVMVCVPDVNRHHEHVRQRGTRILRPPADYPHGESGNIPPSTSPAIAGHSPNPSRMSLPRIGAARPARSSEQFRSAHSVGRKEGA
jgi:uncharacterized glyoxalase superfamily protein PhnB